LLPLRANLKKRIFQIGANAVVNVSFKFVKGEAIFFFKFACAVIFRAPTVAKISAGQIRRVHVFARHGSIFRFQRREKILQSLLFRLMAQKSDDLLTRFRQRFTAERSSIGIVNRLNFASDGAGTFAFTSSSSFSIV
jgi:hypothetical protein